MVDDTFGILGTTLAGTFRVEEVIAEGGFGVVYRAEHVAFRAPVALKCLKIPGTMSRTQRKSFVENFREEAEILFHLSAQIPEVVRPLHADAMTLDDGTFVPYLAMEWVDGRPLDSIIIMREEDGLAPLSLRRTMAILTPIAHALTKAHQFRVPGGALVCVTHSDLKPENLLITENPGEPLEAKILDFGIARARDLLRQNVGRVTDVEEARPFTPSYGAPEQWVPKRYGQSGPWTDVWGMALTMVECLSGRPPIDGDMHVMMGTCLDKKRRPTPRNEGVDIPPDLDAIFERALAVDPRARHQSIEEFWGELEDSIQVPSSFARARSRRDNPTYKRYDSRPPPAPVEAGDDAQEFSGLEFDDDREFVPESAAPSASGSPADYDERDLALEQPANFAEHDEALEEHPDYDEHDEALEEHGRLPSSLDVSDLRLATRPPAAGPGEPASQRQRPERDASSADEELLPDDDLFDDDGPLDGGDGSELMPADGDAASVPGSLQEDEDEDYDLDGPGHEREQSEVASLRGNIGLDLGGDDLRDLGNRQRRSGMSSGPPARGAGRGRHSHGPPAHHRGGASPEGEEAALGAASPQHGSLASRLRVPAIIIAIGLALTVVDLVLAKTMGGNMSLGPVKLRWIAVGLAAVGMISAFWNLLGDRD